MTHSVSNLHEAQTVIVGVDTHKHMHVAVAIDSRGIRLGAHSFGADSEGYRALLTWAEAYGGIEAVGIEGTGGYGVGRPNSRSVHVHSATSRGSPHIACSGTAPGPTQESRRTRRGSGYER